MTTPPVHSAPDGAPGAPQSDAPAFVMYTTPWCGYCMRLKTMLAREGIAFAEVDIEQDPGAADVVTRVNGGNRTVPTVVFPDGEAMTNPSLARITAKLSA